MDIRERFYQNLQESREQLDELRGKGTLDKKDKEKLQGRIRDKHGEAWTETERIRKEKKSKGSEDTKKIDKFRNRLAKIHNKLDEEQMDETQDSLSGGLRRTDRSDLDKQIDFHNIGLANSNYKGVSATHHRKVLRKLMKQKESQEKNK